MSTLGSTGKQSCMKRSNSAQNLQNYDCDAALSDPKRDLNSNHLVTDKPSYLKPGKMDGNEFFAVIAGESSGCFQPTAAAFNVSTSDSDHSPDGLHKSKALESMEPIQKSLNELLLDKGPSNGAAAGDAGQFSKLEDTARTPEGSRRIRGQDPSEPRTLQSASADDHGWGKVLPKMGPIPNHGGRGSYIPYPGAVATTMPAANPPTQSVAPEFVGGNQGAVGPAPSTPVELQVTNLDQSVEARTMKRIIQDMFRDHVPVLSVTVFFQSDGNMAACVRVPSLCDAQFAISQLHRKKVGFKRILISHSYNNSQNPAVLRQKVYSLLREVPSGKIQLFKFREMYEKRFHDSIGVSDLYKMKDIVYVSDEPAGRMVALHGRARQYVQQREQSSVEVATSVPLSATNNTRPPSSILDHISYQDAYAQAASTECAPPPTNRYGGAEENSGVVLDPAFCPRHCPASSQDSSVGWAERENGTLLPNVNLSLTLLGPNMKRLLKEHGGSMPLASLSVCYNSTFVGNENLPVDNEYGVALEHLVSCIRGIQIVQASSGAKKLILMPALSTAANLPPTNPQSQWNAIASGMYNKDELTEAASHLLSGGGFRNSPFSTPGSVHGSSAAMAANGMTSMASSNSSSTSSSMTNLNQIPYGVSQYGVPVPQPQPGAPLAGQLSLFTRELVDLLKATPGCKMPFHKFIPSYHHHFGRQCRVADYGYTKLKDLFEALPHVIQIMGEGRSRAMITLSHRAQVKRFTSDLLRVLKSQASKQVGLMELPSVFEKTLIRKFKISDYGVCDVEDILQEVSETSVVLSGEGDDLYIAIPKREQTQDEMEKTQIFARECIELLRHAPDCRLPFNKFVPAYHHHFGRQCRVADYGFTKLIELFEAIPLTVEITEDADGERLLQLTDCERLKVLGDQIEALIKHNAAFNSFNRDDLGSPTATESMPLGQLEEFFRKQYGYPLRPDDYGECNVVQVLRKLPQLLRVESPAPASPGKADRFADGDASLRVRLIDRTYVRTLGLRVKEILSDQPEGKMDLKVFEKTFIEKFKTTIKIDQIFADLSGLVEVDNGAEAADASGVPKKDTNDNHLKPSDSVEPVVYIKLTSIQLCAVKIQKLLEDHSDKLLCSEFESQFSEKYGTPLLPGQYGYPSLNSLIRALPDNFVVKGKGGRKMIWYQRDGSASPTSEHGGSPNDRQTASFFGSASSRPTPVYGQGAGGGGGVSGSSSIRSMSSGRFAGAGNGSGVASATRFSTSRHEGFRMTTPTRTRPSHGVISHYYGHHNGCQITADRLNNQCTSPIHGLSYGRTYRPAQQYGGSPARGRFNYPPPAHHQASSSMHHLSSQSSIFPTTQQEADLAQFGLVCQNGQIVAAKPQPPVVQPTSQYGQARPPSRNLPLFPSFNAVSATDPFITTPGNSFGLGKVHGSGSGGPSKLISTSPIPSVVGGCPSPTLMTAASTRQTATVTGQHSLLPVPHSPMLADGGPAFFGGANTGSAGGWLAGGASGMHYPEGHPNM